ncbi:hypothetical protein [Latilactobacillus phage TMW 1.1447 P1]|nr:hypothetical protein [Latilactobacillus phage TMW 1.1447 P1]
MLIAGYNRSYFWQQRDHRFPPVITGHSLSALY